MDAIALHLSWLEQRGRSAGTVYHRERYLTRLKAWLAVYGEGSETGRTSHRRPDSACPPDGLMVRQSLPGRPASRRTARAPVSLLEATRDDLLAWRASLQPLAPASVLAATSHVREFYKWAHDEGLITVNPALRIPVPRKPRGLPHPITEQDLLTVLSAAPPRIRPWLILAAMCGLRCCEIAGLRRENIRDQDVPPVLIVSAESAKGGRARIVPLTPFVAAELRLADLPTRGYVFPRLDGHAGPLSAHAVSAAGNRVLRDAGVASTMHALRHRALTQAWRGSRDLLAVARLAGHVNVETTTIYTKLDDSAVVAAVAAIPVPARLRLVAGGER